MASRFPTTRWSLVSRAKNRENPVSQEEMGQLLSTYWRPMVVHLRYKGMKDDRAEDLVQEFILEILGNNLLDAADPAKGRFRGLLLTALDRFMVSRFRYENAAKRSPGNVASLDALEVDITQSSDGGASALAFERAWALDVLAEALARMEQESDESDSARWKVFELRTLKPLLDDADPAEFEDLASQFGLDSPKAAMNLLVTAKRQFARILRTVIREYLTQSKGQFVADPASPGGTDEWNEHQIRQAVEGELKELLDILSRSRNVAEVASGMREDVGNEPLKSAYWNRLTHRTTVDEPDWGNLCDGDVAADHLSTVFDDLLQSPLQTILDDPAVNEMTLEQCLEGAELPLLKSLKNWCTLRRFSPTPEIPAEIVNAIYFLVLAAGEVAHSDPISSLGTEQRVAGFRWLESRDWLPAKYRELASRALH